MSAGAMYTCGGVLDEPRSCSIVSDRVALNMRVCRVLGSEENTSFRSDSKHGSNKRSASSRT